MNDSCSKTGQQKASKTCITLKIKQDITIYCQDAIVNFFFLFSHFFHIKSVVKSSFQPHLFKKKTPRIEYLYRNLEYNKCGNKNRVGHRLVKTFNTFIPNSPFLYLLKTSENCKVF